MRSPKRREIISFVFTCLCSITKKGKKENREDICLQTLLLLVKYANHKNKRSFVSTANEAPFGTLMTIGDVNNIFPITSKKVLSVWDGG